MNTTYSTLGHGVLDSASRHSRITSTRFSLLGPVRAWRGDTELTVGSPQQRTVLALLLLREGALITIDELVDAVWDERPPRTAVTTIRTYISRLRQVLDAAPDPQAPRIIAIGGGYQLWTRPQTVDLWHFRQHTAAARDAVQHGDYDTAAVRLGSALDLDRGMPLTGASGPVIDAQRGWLSTLLSAAAQEQLRVEVTRGRHIEAIPGLVTQTTRHPFHEQLRELLMLALYRAGRQAEALAQFRTAQRILSEELGIDPGPGLRRLHERILGADPGLLNAEAPNPERRGSHRPVRSGGNSHRAGFPHRRFAVKQLRSVS